MIQATLAEDYPFEPLTAQHDRQGFSCGHDALDSYLRRQANQDQERHLASVVVLTTEGRSIDGFYTLSSSSILSADLPQEHGHKLPRFPLPVTLLGRMAIDVRLQGRGLGEFLLLNALHRARMGSTQVAAWAVIVDAKPGLRNFYLKHRFISLPGNPDRLFLPMKTIETIL